MRVCSVRGKLTAVTGQVLEKRLHDRLTPPTGILLQMRINEINGLYDEVMSLMDDCPAELRLETTENAPSVGWVWQIPHDVWYAYSSNYSEDWDRKASREVRSLLLDPKASRTVAKDAFLVQQANIYVTQVSSADHEASETLTAANDPIHHSAVPRRPPHTSTRRVDCASTDRRGDWPVLC